MICDGSCEEHEGEIRQVHVRGKLHDWGLFNYCEVAVKEDQSRGLEVIYEDQTQP